MLRGELTKGLDHDPNFRWRGQTVTRIENLSDIVFALALGMIISSANIPKSYDDLSYYLFWIIPATAAFAVLLGIWHTHFTFFRRYGVADKTIIFLNAILLFVVLYLAYPLRFAFDAFFAFIVGMTGNYEPIQTMRLSLERSGNILGFFGIGFAVVHMIYFFMHRHIIKKRDLLSLTETEIAITYRSRFYHAGTALLSIVTGLLAYYTALNGFAGLLLFLTTFIAIIGKRKYPITDLEN